MIEKKYFINPQNPIQKQYEALRAFHVEGVTAKEVEKKYQYSSAHFKKIRFEFTQALRSKKDNFFQERKRGPKKRSTNTDTIDEVTDEITKKRIICPETKLSYNIAPKELEFYREHDIPLPRRHFDHRTLERFRPLALMITPQQGVCHSCSKEITHYYDPELGYQKIVCVECYQQQMS